MKTMEQICNIAFFEILYQLSEPEMDSIYGMLPVYSFPPEELMSLSDAVCLYIGFPFLMD